VPSVEQVFGYDNFKIEVGGAGQDTGKRVSDKALVIVGDHNDAKLHAGILLCVEGFWLVLTEVGSNVKRRGRIETADYGAGDTYNHEKYIEQALVGALEQGLPEVEPEIVVVDDGSTDKNSLRSFGSSRRG